MKAFMKAFCAFAFPWTNHIPQLQKQSDDKVLKQ